MKKLDPSALTPRTGSIYPPPYDALVAGRSSLRLGDAGGLTQFGVNLITLAPGTASSMRHWHEAEDEFVMVTEGICTMITNDGPQDIGPGDCVAFPAGTPDAHHFVNRTAEPACFLVVGSKARVEVAHYPDQGLKVEIKDGKARFMRADGTPLPPADSK
jgi:uncharacterized cupin superfamily protein